MDDLSEELARRIAELEQRRAQTLREAECALAHLDGQLAALREVQGVVGAERSTKGHEGE